MPVSPSALGAGSSLMGVSLVRQLQKSPATKVGPSKEQLVQRQQKLKAEGKDTSNLDKIISNFDQLSTDGKLDFEKLNQYSSQLGIQLPTKPPRHHHKPLEAATDKASNKTNEPFIGGPPPGFFAENSDSDLPPPPPTDKSDFLARQFIQVASQTNIAEDESGINLSA